MNFPIDLVYMWVDGNDPDWQAKRLSYKDNKVNNIAENASAARWRNNDELRYSLRSAEMYAPWINHIYIVTDNQRPAWLCENHPRVTIVDHRTIFPADALPVFSSSAIESCIYKIPELSEHFILGNDDTLFSAPTTPDVFFNTDGTPIVRVKHFNRKRNYAVGSYHRMVVRMQDMVHEQTGTLIKYSPHHGLDAYRKSIYEYCVTNLYADKWQATTYKRFRHEDDMHRSFVDYYALATGRAQLRLVRRFNRINTLGGALKAILTHRFASDSRIVSVYMRNYDAIMREHNPLMICVNDNERATEADCRRMKAFLEERYAVKSSFEK